MFTFARSEHSLIEQIPFPYLLPRPVCHSVHGRGVYPSMQWAGGVYPSMQRAGGVCPGGVIDIPGQTPPGQIPPPSPQRRPLKRVVRILLECILVRSTFILVIFPGIKEVLETFTRRFE